MIPLSWLRVTSIFLIWVSKTSDPSQCTLCWLSLSFSFSPHPHVLLTSFQMTYTVNSGLSRYSDTRMILLASSESRRSETLAPHPVQFQGRGVVDLTSLGQGSRSWWAGGCEEATFSQWTGSCCWVLTTICQQASSDRSSLPSQEPVTPRWGEEADGLQRRNFSLQSVSK